MAQDRPSSHKISSSKYFKRHFPTLSRKMSTLRTSLRPSSSLRPGTSSLRQTEAIPIEKIKIRLYDTLQCHFNELEEQKVATFDDAYLFTLGIRVESLPTNPKENVTPLEPVFFKPMSIETLNVHPVSEEHTDAISSIKGYPRVVQSLSHKDASSAADFFCTELAWLFGVAIRTNIPKSEHGFGRSLERVSDWVFRE